MAVEQRTITKAYVLSSGRVVKAHEIPEQVASKRIVGDPFREVYERYGLVVPPFDFESLSRLTIVNTYHGRSISQKASDVAGRGWKIVPREGVERPNEENRKRLLHLFSDPNEEMTFRELLENVWEDREGTGNGYIEVGRNARGEPAGLWHVPAHTVRVHKSRQKYAQLRGEKIVWFKAWGVEGNILKDTGEPAPDGTPDEALANELLHFKIYSWVSDYYGVPKWLPAAGAIANVGAIDTFNRSFFESNGVPQYVILIYGAELTDEIEATIEDFFRNRVKGQDRGTLLLPLPGTREEIEVHFEKLAPDAREGSFLDLRRDYVDEVLVAHAMPPYRIGIARVGSLAGSTAEEMTDIYNQSVVAPAQEILEHRLNRAIVQEGFGIEDWELRLETLDVWDEARRAQTHLSLARIPALTINEIRRQWGYAPVEGGDKILIRQGQLVTTLERLMEEAQKEAAGGGGEAREGRRFRALPGGRAR